MIKTNNQFQKELNAEFQNILKYWILNTIDTLHGGFVGEIDHYNNIVPNAPKGIILNTRILWSFSAASIHFNTDNYKSICDRAFIYLNTFFRDQKHKGVYWEVSYRGNPINTRKQIYAQVFTIYALSEYYIYSKNEEAKKWAIEIFEQLEIHAKDPDKLGYFEAFNEDWTSIDDMRLSRKDLNVSKTMNTHLHILEAYTSLLRIYDSPVLKASLKTLINLFLEKIIMPTNHCGLFFDSNWNLLSSKISYGHDIETAWLLIEAAKQLDDKQLLEETKAIALKIIDTFMEEAIDNDGGVFNETHTLTNRLDTDKHWWPQVEALIGLHCAYQLNKDEKYIESSLKIWEFTKKHLIDHKNGEWHFRVNKEGKPYAQEDKVSMWKAPYHTSRACIILNN